MQIIFIISFIMSIIGVFLVMAYSDTCKKNNRKMQPRVLGLLLIAIVVLIMITMFSYKP